jgi:hypothetical protein
MEPEKNLELESLEMIKDDDPDLMRLKEIMEKVKKMEDGES